MLHFMVAQRSIRIIDRTRTFGHERKLGKPEEKLEVLVSRCGLRLLIACVWNHCKKARERIQCPASTKSAQKSFIFSSISFVGASIFCARRFARRFSSSSSSDGEPA